MSGAARFPSRLPAPVFSRRRRGCRRTWGSAHLRSRQPQLGLRRIVMKTRQGWRTAASMAIVTGLVVSAAALLASPQAQNGRAPAVARAGAAWVTAWGTSQQSLSDVQITNATVRMIARVTIPGDNVRIR